MYNNINKLSRLYIEQRNYLSGPLVYDHILSYFHKQTEKTLIKQLLQGSALFVKGLKSHTYVGSGHFIGFKILNFNIFGGFQKNEYLLGYEDFVAIFFFFFFLGGGGVITKLVYTSGSFLNILGSFLKVKVQNGGYFWGLLKFQIFFWGCLKLLIYFGVNGRCLAQAYVQRKKWLKGVSIWQGVDPALSSLVHALRHPEAFMLDLQKEQSIILGGNW